VSEIFYERDRWSGAILLSIGLHLALFITAIISGYLGGPRTETWGGTSSGEAVAANLVSAVPLPARQEPTQNIVANESPGLTQSIPEKVQQEQNAIPIPERDTKRKPQKPAITQAPDIHRPVVPPPDNTVPYGQGGPISGPYGAFQATKVKGGFNFQGGDFGSRYGWYVQVVNRKVSDNWYTMEIGAAANPHRVYITFDIDPNQSGQQAAQQLARRLVAHGISACRVLLPEGLGYDPNSFFAQGGDAHQFQTLLEAAQP